MKWIPQDIESYLKVKEFVDTAVIPLIPLSFGEDMKQAVSMSEFITLTGVLLEKQFAGRILLLPPFTYLTADNDEKKWQELLRWTEVLKSKGFNHIFFLTSDSEWKMNEERLNNSLVWIPAIPLENFEESQKYTIIDHQVSQITRFITRKWN